MPVGGEQPGCKSHEYMLFLVLSLVVSIVVKLGGLEGPLLYSLLFPLRTSSRVFEAFSKHTEVFSRSAGSQPSYINSLDQRFLAQLVNAFGSIRPGSIYSTPAAVCCLPNVAAA